MSRIVLFVLLAASPAAAFDADLAPFLEKKASSSPDPDAPLPVVKPVDPNAPFPKLPPVEAMLNGSSHTVNEIVEEVTKIQARVHSVEQQDQVRLAQKKSDFEAQLRAQEQDTRDVIAENAEIAARITSLQKGNQALRQASKDLQAENQATRAELRSAAAKVTVSGDFIKASEKATDDRRAKVLAVLSEASRVHRRKLALAPVSTDSDDASETQDDATSSAADSSDASDSAAKDVNAEDKPKGSVFAAHRSKGLGSAAHKGKEVEKKKEDDDDEDSDDDKDDDKDDSKDDSKDDGPESFMQYSESEEAEESDSEEAHSDADNSDAPFGHRRASHHKNKASSDAAVDGASKGMLQAVDQELKDLAAEDEQGLERQTQMFHSELSQEHHAYKVALAQQRSLNKTEASLLTMQSKLRRAVGHLQETKTHLQQRVRGVGQYLQHLAHLLLAPDKEAASLVDSMPQDVPIPDPLPQQTAPAVTPPTGTSLAGAAMLQHLSVQALKK